MAHINSYTGEVRSETTTLECSEKECVIRVERAVLDAIDVEPGAEFVLSGKVGEPELQLQLAEQPND